MATLPSIVGQTVDDLKKYSFNDIKLGDTFQTRGILRGVSDEPLDWRLVEMSGSRSTLRFDVSYYGIMVGDMSVYLNENYKIIGR